jgi:hypothetical protein
MRIIFRTSNLVEGVRSTIPVIVTASTADGIMIHDSLTIIRMSTFEGLTMSDVR